MQNSKVPAQGWSASGGKTITQNLNLFRVAQKILLFNQEKKVLLVKASSDHLTPKIFWGEWDLPGGGLKDGESLEKSLEREITEELGKIKFTVTKPILVWDWEHVLIDTKRKTRTICILYEAKYIKGKIVLSREHDEYKWVTLKDLLKIKRKKGKNEFLFIKIAQHYD